MIDTYLPYKPTIIKISNSI